MLPGVPTGFSYGSGDSRFLLLVRTEGEWEAGESIGLEGFSVPLYSGRRGQRVEDRQSKSSK
jgi:hypothetical protein